MKYGLTASNAWSPTRRVGYPEGINCLELGTVEGATQFVCEWSRWRKHQSTIKQARCDSNEMRDALMTVQSVRKFKTVLEADSKLWLVWCVAQSRVVSPLIYSVNSP